MAVAYPAPTVTGDCASTTTITCNPPSGSFFPLGTNTVNCVATNLCRERELCSFLIVVLRDTTPPVVQCPNNITVQACGTNPVPVVYPAPTASDNHSPAVTVTCTPPSGSLFPKGTNIVSCVATDDCTNRSTCSFRIVVHSDATPPMILCPTNIFLWTCATNDAVADYPTPNAIDDEDRSPTVTCSPPSGSLFPVGVTQVRCVAVDDCTNRSECIFTVTVMRDNVSPAIEDCPDNIVRSTCSASGKVIEYDLPEVSDGSGLDPLVSCVPPSGSMFPVGNTMVHCTAVDACTNQAQCTFTVTVIHDTNAPVLQCPTNIVINNCSGLGTMVYYEKPEADDDFLINPQVKCEPPPNSIFPIGTTTVTCTTKDVCGNSNECSFTITVQAGATLPGLDLDQNGLGDIWQIHFGVGSLDPFADSDGDGSSNAEEEVAGTDPLRADWRPLLQFSTTDKNVGEAVWHGVIGKRYQLEATPSLGMEWQAVGSPLVGTGVALEVRVSLEDLPPLFRSQGFFRFHVEDIDTDQDGVTAWEEFIIGTSDRTIDTLGVRGGDPGVAHQHVDSLTTPAGRLREVAAVHVGGTPQGPTATKLVTGAGTGAIFKLSSWNVNAGNQPVHLQDTAPVEGHHIKLHTLTPLTSPGLTLNIFVSGRIRQDQNLFLTTYRVDANGVFSSLSMLGFGLSSSAFVREYAMAHRPLAGSGIGTAEAFQLVTPVIAVDTGGQLHIRVVTWRVNALSGALTATYDTGNLGHPDVPPDGGFLQIRHLDGQMYVVDYSDANSVLSQWFFEVNNAGVVFERGGASSGLPIRGGTNVLAVGANQFALDSLNPRGFLTAVIGTNCALNLQVWEERVVACDAACYSRAFYITDNTLDQSPNANGIVLDPPDIHNSRQENFETDDFFGATLATGDFDGDGYDDVAIGVPGENEEAGAVTVMYGSMDGLAGTGKDQHWSQGSSGLKGSPEGDDGFGLSLAVGDFNGDGRDDLAIGAPGEDIEGENLLQVGVVHVLYGSIFGLTAGGDQLWMQGADGLPGTRQDYDSFGRGLAAGDFDGDGRDDLAIGIPYETVNSLSAGAVQIIYGSAAGLSAAGNQLLHQDSPSMIGEAQEDDLFGDTLAAGDFNGDTRADLAVGIRGQDVNAAISAGAVQIIYGSPAGLGPDNHWFSQENFFPGGANILGTQENYDWFGSALAAGDFNGDGRDDLAVGSRDEDDDISGVEDSGAVNILYGTAAGLSTADQQLLTQNGFMPNGPDIQGGPEAYDYFGEGLAASDFNGDGRDDLAIGAFGEAVQGNTIAAAGTVHIIYGGPSGLTVGGNQLYSQGTSDDDIRDQSEQSDNFGFALAGADVNNDGESDLVIGIPGESFDETGDDPKLSAGAIQVLHGTMAGFGDADEFEWQGTERRVRALLTDARSEQAFGIHEGPLFEQMPPNETTNIHVASVTKCMTLLLAVEHLQNAALDLSLNDIVPVSQLAADTGGSHTAPPYGPILAQGDKMPLALLLHSMMQRSCNKSSVAIAEFLATNYFAHVIGGTLASETACMFFVTNLMQGKAEELNLSNTYFGHPAGGTITSPQDLVTLWRHAWQFPLFRQISSATMYDGQGEDTNGNVKLYFLEKHSDEGGYPGLEGWKGGNGGLWKGFDQPFPVPWCTSSLLGQATRLDRTVIVALQQTGQRWPDTKNLFDYGYQYLYTPDFRGGHKMSGPVVQDFTVRRITDTMSFTAMIDAQNSLRVHTWQVVAGIGQVAPLGNAVLTFNDMPAGTNAVPATLIDMTRLPAVGEAEADYLTGHIENGRLRLDVWRVAAEP